MSLVQREVLNTIGLNLLEDAQDDAGVAQLVERYLAKVNVVSSNLIARSNYLK